MTAPSTGTDLPVVVFSHGYHQSSSGYAPLVDAWAEHFVVVQPTHLDSLRVGLPADDPRTPDVWSSRGDDLTHVLDQLATAVAAVPGLAGRADLSQVAVAGHSWGGQSVGMLLGAGVPGPDGAPGPSRLDARVSAGVLLTTTGTGDSLTPFAAETFPFMHPDYSSLTTRTLVVAGGADQSMLSTRGPEWFTDAYRLSPGATDLITVDGGEHSLGGIAGYGRRRDHRRGPRAGRARGPAHDRLAAHRTAGRRHVGHGENRPAGARDRRQQGRRVTGFPPATPSGRALPHA